MNTFVFALLASIALLGQPEQSQLVHEYPETFVVVAVDPEHDFITLQDFSGYTWTWNSCEDWQVGDIASAIMNSNGTEDITDDQIIMLKYSGYIGSPEQDQTFL